MRQAATMDAWLDWTHPVMPGVAGYPGDPPTELAWLARVEREGYALSQLSLVPHAGTHLDAPAHFVSGGATVDQLSLTRLIGRAELLEVPQGPIEVALLRGAIPVGGAATMLMVRVRGTGAAWLTEEGGTWVVERGLHLIGTEQHDLEQPGDAEFSIHRLLLGRGVLLLEKLALGSAAAGAYDVLVLPMLLAGAEAAPARVLARRVW